MSESHPERRCVTCGKDISFREPRYKRCMEHQLNATPFRGMLRDDRNNVSTTRATTLLAYVAAIGLTIADAWLGAKFEVPMELVAILIGGGSVQKVAQKYAEAFLVKWQKLPDDS